MNCPICNKELIQGDEKRFETLCDHVSDPNEEYGPRPLRSTFICKGNDKCPLDGGLFFWWDDMGDVYIEDYKIYSSLEKKLKVISSQNLLEPQNSFARKMRREEYWRGVRNKLITLKNWKWEFHRSFTCNGKGEVIRKRYKIQCFKRDNPGWIYYSGFWHMLIFCIKQFNRDIKQYKKYKDDYDKKNILKNFEPLKEWELKDNYRKVFHWYVNTFYKSEEIIIN